MRSVEVIKDQRNTISEYILKLTDSINDIKRSYGTDMMKVDHEVRMTYYGLMGLKTQYTNQRNTLNFVLNEDSELTDFTEYKQYKELKVYLK